LNIENELQCFVHTLDDHVITVNPQARLPRNTDRFTSLLEQLYRDEVVPLSGTPLLSLKMQSLQKLLADQSSDLVVALTMKGTLKPLEDVASELIKAAKPVILVGGFQRGHFPNETLRLSSRQYRIDKRPLEAWTVVGRAIYDYERAIGFERF
jgi:rRNA small subunit pseudouridine methyltransferase Nep1